MSLMLAGEPTVGIGFRGMTIAEVSLNQDPISGTAYRVSLTIFAAMHWIVSPR